MIPDFVDRGDSKPIDFSVRIAVDDVWMRVVLGRGISRMVLL